MCGRCNGPAGKGNLDMTHLPVVATSHQEGAALQARGRAARARVTNRRELAKAFVTLNAADLLLPGDPHLRQKRTCLPIARKLAAAGDDLADFALYRVAEVEVDGGELLEAAIELEYGSKRALPSP